MAVLKATRREERGSREVRRLRKQGLIPGVVYGHGEPTEAVTLNEHEVELAVLHGERLVELELDGKKQNVLIKDIQYDTFGQEVLHADLTRVDLDERVEVTVEVVLKGTPVGVTAGDGVLRQVASDVSLECAVRAIPENIIVMVTEMQVGDSLTMADLILPDGAKLLSDPATRVAAVSMVIEEVAAEGEEEETAEPEVIGDKGEPEGESEGESNTK